jgi:hypothetical protein
VLVDRRQQEHPFHTPAPCTTITGPLSPAR